MTSLRSRLAASLVVLMLLVAGCGPSAQGGSPREAAGAADAFLSALVDGDAADAWAHLSPATRAVIYDDDRAEFAREVAEADWSRMTWRFDAIVDLEISWGVHVLVEEAAVPAFLIERQIAAGWDGFGIVLHVQTPHEWPYLIAAQGLDNRL